MGLQTVLQMISIHVAGTAPAIVLAEVVPRLKGLEQLLIELREDGRKKATNIIFPQRSDDTDEYESVVLQTNSQLSRSAQALLTEVKSVVSEARYVFG